MTFTEYIRQQASLAGVELTSSDAQLIAELDHHYAALGFPGFAEAVLHIITMRVEPFTKLPDIVLPFEDGQVRPIEDPNEPTS